jgi:hypothetical protein
VLIPYSLMSSKLDVYMMAMIPPIALLIAEYVTSERGRPARWLNAISIAIMGIVGIAGLFVTPRMIKGPEGAFVQLPAVKIFCIITIAAAMLAFVIALRSSLVTSTIAAGLVPIISMIVIAIALMPFINDISSTRPLVAALEKQNVPPEQIALYAAPYLWTRDMPRDFEHVMYATPYTLAQTRPTVIVTARAHAGEIAPSLYGYQMVDPVRMIGKWFYVYRR